MIFSFIKLVTIEGVDWSPILAGRAEWLDRPFSEEEIHNVVLHLNNKKAPSPNGFTIAFSHDFFLH